MSYLPWSFCSASDCICIDLFESAWGGFKHRLEEIRPLKYDDWGTWHKLKFWSSGGKLSTDLTDIFFLAEFYWKYSITGISLLAYKIKKTSHQGKPGDLKVRKGRFKVKKICTSKSPFRWIPKTVNLNRVGHIIVISLELIIDLEMYKSRGNTDSSWQLG